MNLNGEQLINALCKRLEFNGTLLYDHNIRRLLSTLTRHELTQLITFGDVDTWKREFIKKEQEKELLNQPQP